MSEHDDCPGAQYCRPRLHSNSSENDDWFSPGWPWRAEPRSPRSLRKRASARRGCPVGSTTWSHCIGRLHSSGWKTSWSIPDLLSSTRCTQDTVPKSLALHCADVGMPRCTTTNLNGELACPVRHSRSRQPLHSDLRRGHILQKSLLPLPVREGKISSAANVTSRTTRRSRLLATPPDFPPRTD